MEDRLYKKLEAYGKSDFYPFHMPGHKRNPLAVEGDFPVEMDITEIDGFDNLHHAEDILKRAQEDVARLYGVPESFYSINGSSGAFPPFPDTPVVPFLFLPQLEQSYILYINPALP